MLHYTKGWRVAGLLAALALTACGGGDAEMAEPLLAAQVRQQSISVPDQPSAADLVVHRYFSPLLHGPTQWFRRWDSAGVVLQLRATDTLSEGLVVTARYLLFSGADLTAQIDRWINNQYSDALYPGGVDPVVIAVTAQTQTYVSIGTETGSVGDSYEVKRLQLSVPAVSQAALSVAAQSIELPVYLALPVNACCAAPVLPVPIEPVP